MKRVCAWCGLEMGAGVEADGPGHAVTHGICPSCAARFAHPGAEHAQRFLDSLGVPVLVVDAQAYVLAANTTACTTLGQQLPKLRDRPGGDALECAWARLPGGCGKTVHCQACAVRRTVLDTARTGADHERVEAYQQIESPNGLVRRRVVISTERVGACVLLRIDELEPAA